MSGSLRLRRGTTTPRALALAGSLLRGLALVALALAAAGCSPGARVTIANASRDTLAGARIVGERDSTLLAPLPPGARVTRRIGVRGEDAIALRGTLGGAALAPMMAVYVEPGLRVTLVVDSSGVVRPVNERVGGY